MLINCPRCGFQQPKDKYCAQCGVDIENFKPVTPPAWKRFFGNPLIQLSLVIFVASGVGITLYQKGQQNLERRVSNLKSTVQINSTSGETLSAPEYNNTANQDTEVATQASEAADGVVEAYKVSAPTAPAPASGANSPELAAAKAAPTAGGAHLVVYYAEVARGRLNSIMAASRSTGQFMSFNEYSAGILPDFNKTVLNRTDIKVLHKEERPLTGSKTMQWSYTLKDRRDPGIEIGLTTFFELSDFDNNNLRGNLEIQRNWRELVPGAGFEIQRKSFPAIFEIGGETGFFMSGVMPPSSNMGPEEEQLMSFEIYKILRSPQFRSGESDFVIFVEFEKGN